MTTDEHPIIRDQRIHRERIIHIFAYTIYAIFLMGVALAYLYIFK